jgi:hypothetical protein
VTARVLLASGQVEPARRALEDAPRNPAAGRPWFEWQLPALTAAIDLRKGHLTEAWIANGRARGILRSLRSLVGNEHERASWAGSRQDVWEQGLEIATRRERPDDALAVIEDAKSTHLARMLIAQSASGTAPAVATEIREAIGRLSTSVSDPNLPDAVLAARHHETDEL